jgi:hypothetical protein
MTRFMLGPHVGTLPGALRNIRDARQRQKSVTTDYTQP